MYVLINAPEGVLNEDVSVVGAFRHRKDARDAMYESIKEVLAEEEADDQNDYFVCEDYGECYQWRTDRPRWLILKV